MDQKQFASAITPELLNVVHPCFGQRHDHRFEGQNDQWSSPNYETTGISLSHYVDRLEQLRIIPARSISDIKSERNSATDEFEGWETLHPSASSAMTAALHYGGSMRTLKQVIRKQAQFYMKGFPGRDSLALNTGPHRLIRKCIDSPDLLHEAA